MLKSYRFFISGKVQGVFYRKSVQENAQKHGFSGFVMNLPDGRVEVGVSLEEHRMDEFLDILKNGSAASEVTGIDAQPTHEVFEGIFEIRH